MATMSIGCSICWKIEFRVGNDVTQTVCFKTLVLIIYCFSSVNSTHEQIQLNSIQSNFIV